MMPDLTQPPTAAEVAIWLQNDAVQFRDAADRVVQRWGFIGNLPEGALPNHLVVWYRTLYEIAATYYAQYIVGEPRNFDAELREARRGVLCRWETGPPTPAGTPTTASRARPAAPTTSTCPARTWPTRSPPTKRT
jgi:hypothetical protein